MACTQLPKRLLRGLPAVALVLGVFVIIVVYMFEVRVVLVTKQYTPVISKQEKHDPPTFENPTLSDDEFASLAKVTQWKSASVIDRLPRHNTTYHQLTHEYAVLTPIGPDDDIFWTKNLYSDFNLFLVCDHDDSRAECDYRLPDNYVYKTLPKKTFDMLQIFCLGSHNYKAIFKLDFDVLLDKRYFLDVLEFMIANHQRRLYYGSALQCADSCEFYMDGPVYGLSRSLLDDYCACDVERPDSVHEDVWVAITLTECLLKSGTFNSENLTLIASNDRGVFHKKFAGKRVKLYIGS
ncbi:hypothetical protein AX774_g4804 [Zancudomyces culisetae]|uniref:Hexosyltransferase n=1 Tax=Zancudomyces culisetae TaxID=1213189 RepID=A0A1R1PLB8_ZANCU|nr:hypothetical protein AX774_g4804 [Zancudomyces culisetae]|eukprot:OMH81737.1 hypothetical protein AX774_g4804 [Zancudomyces culisetae]